jgi:hypothetical protein
MVNLSDQHRIDAVDAVHARAAGLSAGAAPPSEPPGTAALLS